MGGRRGGGYDHDDVHHARRCRENTAELAPLPTPNDQARTMQGYASGFHEARVVG